MISVVSTVLAYNKILVRHWISFDYSVTNREFAELPSRDAASLFRAMKRYAIDERPGWIVKDYGEGLLMIKAANQTQGRCLFFTIQKSTAEGQSED